MKTGINAAVSAPPAIRLNRVSGRLNAEKKAVASGPVPKRALNMLCRMTPNPFEVRYAIARSNAPSVTLKRRSEKLVPKRKLAGLKRNVLPHQRLRRRRAVFPSVDPREDGVGGSAVAAAVGERFTGLAGSCVMCFSPSH